MSLQVKGKLIEKLPVERGEGRKGTWQKQSFVVETDEQFPKKICIVLWGDKINMLEKVALGDILNVSINIESREYNTKWYTDVRAWRIDKEADQGSPVQPMPNDPPADLGLPEDDLPF